MRRVLNVFRLSVKELWSLRADPVMMVLIVYAFTAAVVTVAKGVKLEVSNAAVAMVDLDHSVLSGRLADALTAPYFRRPVQVSRAEADRGMDHGAYSFAIEIPPDFEADVLRGRRPEIGVTVDATAMAQAGNGVAYIQQIVTQEVATYLLAQGVDARLPIATTMRMYFNPNLDGTRFNAVMQVINSITILSIILVGAAVVREREHGTIEHLLVMPVSAAEIALSKVLANSLVILVVVTFSVEIVVKKLLGVPVAGSMPLFLTGTAIYLFSTTSLGILLATVANSMPQLGLLAIPVFVTMQLLSGGITPLESMPDALQKAMHVSPSVYFVQFAQAILYRGAGLSVVWPQLLTMAGIGAVFLVWAITRFRAMLAKAG